jgi:hypothetical protein
MCTILFEIRRDWLHKPIMLISTQKIGTLQAPLVVDAAHAAK